MTPRARWVKNSDVGPYALGQVALHQALDFTGAKLAIAHPQGRCLLDGEQGRRTMHFHTVHGLTVRCQTQRNGPTPAVEVEDNLMTLERSGSVHERVQPFHLDRIHLKKRLRLNTEQPCTNTLMHHLSARNVARGAIEQLGSLPRLHVQEQPSDQIMQALP